MKILFATRNKGKLVELRALLADQGFAFVGLDDLADPPPDTEETGATFAENAAQKARAAMQATGLPCIADDSGLEVDALDGRPGVRSARYADSDAERIARLLGELEGTPDAARTARFCCAVAFVHPDDPEGLVLREGHCAGRILRAPRGHNGFGYDPVFFVEQLGQTFAEAPAEEKNRLSHRGRAMRALAAHLRARFGAG
jgi:XTP/dITP diphosphohydrolase